MEFEVSKQSGSKSSICNIGFFAEELPGKLYFGTREVVFSEKHFRYAAALAAFRPQAKKAREEMESNFNDKIGSLDEFVEYGVNWVNEELSTLLDFTLEQLALNGCSGLSKDEFYRQYVAEKLHDIPALYDQMEEALDEMREEQERVNRRRVADRHERVAAGENEIGMMLWNGIKRSGDGILNLTKAAMIYDDEVKQKIKAEFSYLCDTMVDSFAEALFDQEELDLRSPVSIEDRRRTAAMMKNLHTGKISAAKVDDAAFEVFYRNPFTPGILDWAVERYGDENGELQKTADALHIDISFTKEDAIERTFLEIDFSSEETTLAGKEKFLAREKFIGIRSEEKENKIDETLKEFDLRARTFDGVEYETRQQASAASELTDFFNSLDFSSEEKMNESQKAFLKKEKELNLTLEKLEQKIADMYKKQDQAARTFNGVEYETREEVMKLRQEYEELASIVNSAALVTKEEVNALIDKIRSSQYTIPHADYIVERLKVKSEMFELSPWKDVVRLLLQHKLIVAVILFLWSVIITNASEKFGCFFMIIFIIWIGIMCFTTRKGLLARAEKFFQSKNYNLAAYCFDLAQASREELLGLKENL